MSVRQGDAVVQELGLTKIGAIKIDTEGTEISVLRGLSETIRRDRPLIFIEILKPLSNQNADQRKVRFEIAGEIEQWAKATTYQLFQIGSNGEVAEVGDIHESLISNQGRNFVLMPS